VVKKDWTNKKFGRITLLKRSDKKQRKSYLWEGICDCQTPVLVLPSQIANGNVISCGCYSVECSRHRQIKDWTGKKFGRIVFTKRTEKQDKSGAYKWEGICDCGNSVCLIPNDAKRGCSTSCGCYQREQHSKNAMSQRKYSPQISSARKLWQFSYKDGNLTFPEFLELSQKNCHYCGIAPYRIINPHSYKASAFLRENGNFVYNGLDRIDSSKRHDADNVVPCCKHCNQAKMDLPVHEFMELISRIYHHSVKEYFKKENEVPSSDNLVSSVA
jgi:hypothetical protein